MVKYDYDNGPLCKEAVVNNSATDDRNGTEMQERNGDHVGSAYSLDSVDSVRTNRTVISVNPEASFNKGFE